MGNTKPSTRHPIDETRTADYIAVECLANHLTSVLKDGEDAGGIAKKLIEELRSLKYSVVPIQQGQLSQLLDSLGNTLAENAKLEKKVDGLEALRPQINAIWEKVINLK